MLVEHLDVEADALLGGEGVHVAADGIHLARDVFRAAVLRPLEDHVLDEVRDAVDLRIFVARAGLDPYADRNRTDVLHLFGQDGETVRQYLATNVAEFFHHFSVQRVLLTRNAADGAACAALAAVIVTHGEPLPLCDQVILF